MGLLFRKMSDEKKKEVSKGAKKGSALDVGQQKRDTMKALFEDEDKKKVGDFTSKREKLKGD